MKCISILINEMELTKKMIKSLKITNYKSIIDTISLDFSSDMPLMPMFGKNGSGKSTIFEAIYLLKEVFLFGMRSVDRIFMHNPTTFELELELDNQIFLYKVVLSLDKNEITHESLILTTPSNTYIYFIRDQYDITLGERLEKLFNRFDFERFKTYLYDLRFDKREFILSHLRIKDFSDSKNAIILNKLVDDIKNIHIFNENADIRFYLDMDDAHYISVLSMVSKIYPEIESLQYRKVTLDELRFNLNRHRYDHLLDAFRNHVTKFSTTSFFVDAYNQFYKLKGRSLNELTVQAIDVYFKDGLVVAFDKLSSGLKKLLLLSMILLKTNPNDLILIDDLTKDMDHHTTLDFIDKIGPILKTHQRKLMFSTHDMLLLDSQIFDLKNICYTVKRDKIVLHYLNKLGIRKDKKLLNLYFEGFFDTL